MTGPIIIRSGLASAFRREAEADIVDQLRISFPDTLSLIALLGDRLVGQVLFTPAMIEAAQRSIVGPDWHRWRCCQVCRSRASVRVWSPAGSITSGGQARPPSSRSGQPAYYSRFSLLPASCFQIPCPFADVSDEAFMILILNEAPLHGVAGIARYRPEFSAAL